MKYVFALLLPLCLCSFLSAQYPLYSGKPIFHGAERVGNYPNTFFLHTIAATGARPISFSAKGLPQELVLDSTTGIITGTAPASGNYEVSITATNSIGSTATKVMLYIGDKLALTPPMGWNSWNVITWAIDENTIKEIADAMVTTGMRDIGYQYINIDDFWHGESRDKNGKPLVNTKKFPNGMKALADYVHNKILKLGIYSCAGKLTCGEKFGGYGYETIDAQTYAEWGIDLLKYDYCFAPLAKKDAIERYTTMGSALAKSGRSIVFSVCEWGLRKPWKWASEQAHGHYWRTTPDIFDTWKGGTLLQMSIIKILKRQKRLEQYAGPGSWNDPDMLIVGNYGAGKATPANGKHKGLNDTQYQSHFAIWCLLNAPLLSSCDLRTMNTATKNILLNAELTDLNQDVLGKQASLIYSKKGIMVYKKDLKNEGFAIAFLNTSNSDKTMPAINAIGLNAHDFEGKKCFDPITLKQDDNLPASIAPYETVIRVYRY
jgi:alpha-galactosidase